MIEYPVVFRGHRLVFAVDNPQDAIQAHHVRGQFYEEEELDYLRTVIPPRVTVADAGANVGNHAIFFSKICRAERVFAFEANPAAIGLLTKNVLMQKGKNLLSSKNEILYVPLQAVPRGPSHSRPFWSCRSMSTRWCWRASCASRW